MARDALEFENLKKQYDTVHGLYDLTIGTKTYTFESENLPFNDVIGVVVSVGTKSVKLANETGPIARWNNIDPRERHTIGFCQDGAGIPAHLLDGWTVHCDGLSIEAIVGVVSKGGPTTQTVFNLSDDNKITLTSLGYRLRRSFGKLAPPVSALNMY